MDTRTVSAGIDLGTTNSSIAILKETGPDILKNNLNENITPSVVYIDKKETTFVGSRAKNSIEEDPTNGHEEFKRQMGQQNTFRFKDTKKTLKASELSAKVLQHLAQIYHKDTGSHLKSAVITYPAMFESPACKATTEAAQQAGIEYAILLQEPLAAALAYGFRSDQEKSCWLVYDFGGGTFDISIVMVRDGVMQVVDHSGDNYLGGKNFDAALFDYIVSKLVEQQYDVKNLIYRYSPDPQMRTAYAKLITAVRRCKLELSQQSESHVEVQGVLCKDRNNKDVYVEVPIHRVEYEKLISPFVQKTVRLCKNIMRTNRLEGKVEKMILVGGPTQTPFLRQMLKLHLRMELDFSVDPMTVVTQGAAIYAATQQLPQEMQQKAAAAMPASEVALQLQYESSSVVTQPFVGGEIQSNSGSADLSVEILRLDGGWSSGKLALTPEGKFMADVVLQPQKSNKFDVVITDQTGQRLSVGGSEFTILHHGMVGDIRAKLANSIRVGLKGDQTVVLVKKGSDLPAKGEGVFYTSRTLRQGSSGDFLHVGVVEGENSSTSRNVHIGTLKIPCTNLRRDIPEGSEIEITVSIDKSRQITTIAYLPILDEEYRDVINLEGTEVNTDELQKAFEKQTVRLADVEALQRKSALKAVTEKYQVLAPNLIVDAIKNSLDRASQGDADACQETHRNILRLTAALDELEKLQVWSRMKRQIKKLEEECAAEDMSEIMSLQRDILEAEATEEHDRVPLLQDRLSRLDQRALLEDADLWQQILSLQYVCLQKMGKLKDQNVIFILLEATKAIKQKDGDRLKQISHGLTQTVAGLQEMMSQELQLAGGNIKETGVPDFEDLISRG